MATAQMLKKKLRGIRSIQKVSLALKSASTAKFSKLSSAYGDYSEYAARCRKLYEANRSFFEKCLAPKSPDAPVCFVIMCGNKGMCGSFNTDLLSFAAEQLQKEGEHKVLLCGNFAKTHFDEKKIPYEKAFVFNDVPQYPDAVLLFDTIRQMLLGGVISGVEIIYPKYSNMLKQAPARCSLRESMYSHRKEAQPLFFPDRESIVEGMADKILTAFLYEKVLECALGAQAATLMTMRSSYDTAVEYGQQLESEINRIRQKTVTADVIETSAEFSREED